MKTLKLSDEKALELYKIALTEFKQLLEENFGKDFFKPKSIIDKIQDLDDVFDYLEMDEDDVYIFPKNTKCKFERYINACAIIPKIVSVYNEGEELDWNNSNQYKYLPYYKLVGLVWSYDYYSIFDWDSYSACAHYYKNSNLCVDACKKFNQIYVDYYSFKG